MRKKSLFKLLVLLTLYVPAALALEYKILADVNGESISTVQVRERVDLVLSSSGHELNEENRKKATPEVVEGLIDEILQRKDADTKKIKITDADFNQVISDLEKSNNLQPGGFRAFIASKGISYDAVSAQIKAGILWKKIVTRYIRPTITVNKDDIEKAKNYKEPEPVNIPEHTRVNLSEIVIPVEYGKDKEAEDLAESISRTANTGAKDFGDLAKKYSVGKTADKKGEIGWLPEEGLAEPLGSNIKETETGKVTKPIRVKSLFVIIKVNDRQTQAAVQQKKLSPEDRATVTKMEDAAKKYMKNLRESAYIKKRYTDENLYQYVWGE